MDGNVYDEEVSAIENELLVETVSIEFEHVDENLKWEEIFPEWIDENGEWGPAKCPHVPVAGLGSHVDLNVVVARVPCGVRDVFGLQVNLVVANLAVKSEHRNVYVVFVGSCGPMVEIFRCDDLLMHGEQYWLYKPDLRRLKHKTLMPLGSCQIAQTGKEVWREFMAETPKLAYVTVLHSSEDYVCGAIALAQSILQTKTKTTSQTIDLILLADKSIGPKSTEGLESAGWKIQRIQRIQSPFAKKGAYNEWNYSKLRIWQLTSYDKIIFIDSDLLVLKSIEHLFSYPQLSAAGNDLTLFNSGLMVVEPSQCMFLHMMDKTSEVRSYNGGDQGFLNEIFAWWHRLSKKVNHMKTFVGRNESGGRAVPADVYAVHYLGLKPWTCYRDYDCNWDTSDRRIFASDEAHESWWKVHDAMPKELQPYCGLTQKMNERIIKWRRKARNASFSDGHWNIQVKDPRRHNFSSD
uniref:Hexosyltransferase n=2 Tax=Cajanus cajan TaxID=3821 RepID=A0A151TW20_CAJCA|nr:Glycogenin-1 [Cajanus cajan]